jgi:hypothetical protein
MQNSPLPQYRQHHEVEAPVIDAKEFRLGWRRRSRLFSLAESGRIGREELVAGLALRAAFEAVGHQRTQQWSAKIDQVLLPGSRTQHELRAARLIKQAAAALGRKRMTVLEFHLVSDMPWNAIGRRLNIGRDTAVRRVVEALEALALWRAGKPVPKPPRIRI